MTLRGALLAATMLALPVAASAQPVTGLYVTLGGGVNLMQDQEVHSASIPSAGLVTSGGSDLKLHVGPALEASVGWGFGNGLRAEIEGNFDQNLIYGLTNSTAGVAENVGGTEEKYGAMFNVLYDFVGLSPWVQPYVGAGVGYEVAKMDNLHYSAFSGGTGVLASFPSDSQGHFAYQAIIGAAFPVHSVPGLALTAEYRFMGLTGDQNYSGTATVSGVGVTPVGVTLHDNFNHSFLVGVRYNFGQEAPPAPMAAPAPVPAPAVQPARSYLVFFDWDKATLTQRARQIIHEAAENSTRVQYTQINVNGYTDTSGSAKYNMGLSIRRAQAVANELVRDGVPKNAIVIKGFGETHLLVPTGPNVREPQNRRVEIIIR